MLTSRTIWSGLEIAPGMSAVRGTVSAFVMWPAMIVEPGRPGRDVRGGDEHVDVLCAVLHVLSVIGDVDGHEHGGEQAEHDGHYDIPELIRHVIPRVVGGSIPIKELS